MPNIIIPNLKATNTAQLHIGLKSRESAFQPNQQKMPSGVSKAAELFELTEITHLSRIEERKNVDESFVQWHQKTKQPRDPK